MEFKEMKDSKDRAIANPSIQITQINSQDQIQNLLYEFKNVFSPELTSRIENLNEYAKKLHRHATVMVATINRDTIAGFVAYYINRKESGTSYLTQIAVHPQYQHMGIGQMLLLTYETDSMRNSFSQLMLEVNKENTPAISFYRKNGFKRTGETIKNTWYMTKNVIDPNKKICTDNR